MTNKNFFALMLIFLLIIQYRFLYLPGKNRIDYLNSSIAKKESELETLQKLCIEYKAQERTEDKNTVKIAREGFSLFSYTGGLITNHNLEKNIEGIQPLSVSKKEGFSIERVKLTLKDITLKQLYDFLYEIETSRDTIYIPEFRMHRNKEKNFLLGTEMELIAVKRIDQSSSP
jgi:hypothetical protein